MADPTDNRRARRVERHHRHACRDLLELHPIARLAASKPADWMARFQTDIDAIAYRSRTTPESSTRDLFKNLAGSRLLGVAQ